MDQEEDNNQPAPKEEESVPIKDVLNCPGCGESMKTPISLPCLHNFCMDCLKREHELQKQRQEAYREQLQEASRQGTPLEREEEEEEEEEESDEERPPNGSQYVQPQTQQQNSEFITNGPAEVDYRNVSSPSAFVGGHDSDASDYFCCPVKDCSEVTTITLDDPNDLNNLEVNLPLQNLERTMSIKKDLPLGRVRCECGQNAVGVCYNKDCNNRPFCGNCIEYHLRDKKKHQIAYPDSQEENNHSAAPAPLASECVGDDRQPRKKAWKDLKQGDIFCHIEDHEDFRRCYYCSDHDAVICLACIGANEHHRRCEQVQAANLAYDQQIGVTNDKLEEVKQLRDRTTAAMATANKLKEGLELRTNDIKNSIKERYKALKQNLKTQRDDLLNKCEILQRYKTDELNKHLGMLERVCASFKRCIDLVTVLKQELIASEFMMLKSQLDQRMDKLVTTRSNYHYDPIEDECIFFEENVAFDISNAIGRVYSTPSVRNFSLSALTNAPIANHPIYFSIVTHDHIRNHIISHSGMPKLQVTIRHIDESEVLKGHISKDSSTGEYCATVLPSRSGKHEVCIYQPLKPPYNRQYVGQKKYIVTVDSDRFPTFPIYF